MLSTLSPKNELNVLIRRSVCGQFSGRDADGLDCAHDQSALGVTGSTSSGRVLRTRL